MKVGVAVPVMLNFEGFTKLMHSIQGNEFTLYVEDNWNENIGVATAWNKFLDKAIEDKIDRLFILNDDVTFEPGSFQGALEVWETRPEDCIVLTGSYREGNNEFLLGHGEFASFLINPQQALDEVGYFDAKNFPTYHEDNDFEYRAKLLGWRRYAHTRFSVIHEGSKTQFWHGKDKGIVSHEKFREGEKRYRNKWGGLPRQEKFIIPYNLIGGER